MQFQFGQRVCSGSDGWEVAGHKKLFRKTGRTQERSLLSKRAPEPQEQCRASPDALPLEDGEEGLRALENLQERLRERRSFSGLTKQTKSPKTDKTSHI